MKIFTGKVIKVTEKTAKVEVERVLAHPLYTKRIKRVKNYLVHDEIGVAVGDVVSFVATKPYSKLKKWKIVEANKKENKK